MNVQYPKYLPLGSVVLLKGGKKRLMIIGYAPIDMGKMDKVYDYSGCMYPEGVISSEKTLLFDHDDIDKIFCLGFQDDEGQKFLSNLKATLTPENIATILENAKKEGN